MKEFDKHLALTVDAVREIASNIANSSYDLAKADDDMFEDGFAAGVTYFHKELVITLTMMEKKS